MSKTMEGAFSMDSGGNHLEVSDAVVYAVAEAEEVSPLELTPLTHAIDPDALNNFVVSLNERHDSPTGHVEFQYRQHVVTVTADGSITVD